MAVSHSTLAVMEQPNVITHTGDYCKMIPCLQASGTLCGVGSDDASAEGVLMTDGWRKILHIHGRSSDYYLLSCEYFTVITTADVAQNSVRNALMEPIGFLRDRLMVQVATPSPEKLGAYIELDTEAEGGDVPAVFKYYLVDHEVGKISWMQEAFTDHLGLPPVWSTKHLDIGLKCYYWKHVLRFPSHIQLREQLFRTLHYRLTLASMGLARPEWGLPLDYELCKGYLKKLQDTELPTIFGPQHANRIVLLAEISWKSLKHGFEVPYKDVEVAVDFPPGMSFSRLLLCVICFNIPVRYIKDLHGDTFLRKRQAGLMVQKWRACYSLFLAMLSALSSVYLWVLYPADVLSVAKQFARDCFGISQGLFTICLAVDFFTVTLRGEKNSIKTERLITWVSNRLRGEEKTDKPLVILALFIAAPEVLFIWATMWFTLAIGSLATSKDPCLALVVLGALAIVLLTFIIDGQVNVPGSNSSSFSDSDGRSIAEDFEAGSDASYDS